MKMGKLVLVVWKKSTLTGIWATAIDFGIFNTTSTGAGDLLMGLKTTAWKFSTALVRGCIWRILSWGFTKARFRRSCLGIQIRLHPNSTILGILDRLFVVGNGSTMH